MAAQRGLFDPDERYAALSKAGDPLERLAGGIDFELFRPELPAGVGCDARSFRWQAGRAPADGPGPHMFKVPVIQVLYGLSDAQAAFQIMDRRSFARFLGLDDGERAPDETTIRRFREALARTGAVEKLFARLDAHLKDAGYLARISRHGRADRRCHHRGGPAPAHDRYREGDRQGRGHPA